MNDDDGEQSEGEEEEEEGGAVGKVSQPRQIPVNLGDFHQ
jgi:hypothetical protein